MKKTPNSPSRTGSGRRTPNAELSGNPIWRLFLAVALVVSFAASALAETDAQFVRANDEFARQQYQNAIRDYQSIVQSGEWSTPLFYNLGNAYFRIADYGRAILNYERALALDPHHPETTANLALAREEARALELQNNQVSKFLKQFVPNQLIIAGAIGFWIAVFAIVARMLARRGSLLVLTVAILGLVVALGCAAGIYQVEASRKSRAIVIATDVRARLATADNAGSVLQLPAGSEINVLSRRGDWIYAALPNNLRGWIPSSSVEPVRL
jgi:tetratricopeptide (TPR) repeat protein